MRACVRACVRAYVCVCARVLAYDTYLLTSTCTYKLDVSTFRLIICEIIIMYFWKLCTIANSGIIEIVNTIHTGAFSSKAKSLVMSERPVKVSVENY